MMANVKSAPLARIWLCADDYGISPGVNRAIRDLIKRGRLNATSVMMVAPAIGRDEAAALQDVVAERNAQGNRCAVGLHVTLTAPFRPITMHFRPLKDELFLPFARLLRAGQLRRLDPEVAHLEAALAADPQPPDVPVRQGAAVIVDHLIPPMTQAETYDDLARLEQLLDDAGRKTRAMVAYLDNYFSEGIRVATDDKKPRVWTIHRHRFKRVQREIEKNL